VSAVLLNSVEFQTSCAVTFNLVASETQNWNVPLIREKVCLQVSVPNFSKIWRWNSFWDLCKWCKQSRRYRSCRRQQSENEHYHLTIWDSDFDIQEIRSAVFNMSGSHKQTLPEHPQKLSEDKADCILRRTAPYLPIDTMTSSYTSYLRHGWAKTGYSRRESGGSAGSGYPSHRLWWWCPVTDHIWEEGWASRR